MEEAATDARRLASAACFVESDIHCSPTQLIGATRRYNANFPESYFQITDDSRALMQEVSKEYQDFLDTTNNKKVGRKSELAFMDYLLDHSSMKEDLK
jgi:hypothetical protein